VDSSALAFFCIGSLKSLFQETEAMETQANAAREQISNSFLSRVIKFQIVIAVIVVIVSIIVGIRIPSLIKQRNQLEQELQQKREELNQTGTKLEESKALLLAINPILEKYGVLKELTITNLNSSLVKQSFEANQQIQNMLSESFKRRDVPVWYYSKDVNVDPTKVRESLDEFGFKVVPQPPGRPDLPTNLIAFGNRLSPDEAKLVAYTLIRAGIEIRGMCRISNQSKASIIEVLADDRILNKTALTVEQIHNKTEFIQCLPNNVEWPQE
jgi:hypothetical protein